MQGYYISVLIKKYNMQVKMIAIMRIVLLNELCTVISISKLNSRSNLDAGVTELRDFVPLIL